VKVSEVLTKARALLAGGWNPISLAADGTICSRTDEGITKFCARDAIATAAAGDSAADDAAELELNRALRARGDLQSFTLWEQLPGRTQAEVLELFARAERHALAEESRDA
jgi:hypothetical protein